MSGFIGIVCAIVISGNIQAQEVCDTIVPGIMLKSNLLYDATTTINLGAEFRIDRKLTLDLPFSYNPWTFSGGKKIRHWLIQPELRYWTKESFKGVFWGLHLHGAQFNTSKIIDDYRYEGWLAGAGLSFGYRWNLSSRWGIEATIGAGYAYIDYTKYADDVSSADCNTCGQKLTSDKKQYWGPTRAGLSISYTIGKTSGRKQGQEFSNTELPYPISQPIPPVLPSVSEAMPQIVIQRDTQLIQPEELQYLQKEGCAYIQFPLNRYDLLPEFRNNKEELDSIKQLVKTINEIPGVKIENITIESYTSPEGDLDHNIFLSRKRAEALRDFLSVTYGLGMDCFTVRSRGENWEGLCSALAKSYSLALTDKERGDLMRIIDIEDISTRKTLLKEYNGGKVYDRLMHEVYPLLRASIYKISYTIPVPAGKKTINE
jgi:outer membrane protein OmpA-like peptidoglycan-associated protein